MKKYILFTIFLAFVLKANPLPKWKDVFFGEPLNTQNIEYNPIISPNGRYLVFQSNRPGGEGGMDIWVSENLSYPDRTKTPIWSDPKNFRELNTPNFEGMFSILFDEKEKPIELFFTSERLESTDPKKRRDGFEELNIYYTKINSRTGNWSLPIHLNEINSNFDDKMPAISPDGCSLIFVSNRPGGFGGNDLWITKRKDCRIGVWQRPTNLGEKINSSAHEIMPQYHWDGQRIYFSSNKNDQNKKFSFFYSDFDPITGEFSTPISMGLPFNTSRKMNASSTGYPFDTPNDYATYSLWEESDNEGFSQTHDDLWMYFSSNRPGGLGQFDIYRTQTPEDLRRTYDFVFRGLVLDGSEDKMIGLDSTIKIMDGEKPVQIITSSRIGGDLTQNPPENFKTVIKTGKFYRVEVSSPGFFPTEITMDLRGNAGQGKEQYSQIVLLPIKPAKPPRQTPPDGSIRFVVKDKKTDQIIENAKLIYFDDRNRRGSEVKRIEETFFLEKPPELDFEIFTQAENYKTETFLFKKSQVNELKEKVTVLYLRNLTDFNDSYNITIYFPFNQRNLSAEDKAQLDKLAKHLLSAPTEILEIGGHTDNVGSKDYNIKLSEDRARAVQSYLVEKGIPTNRIKIQAYYYSQPIESNDTDEGRAKNRRVNFKRID